MRIRCTASFTDPVTACGLSGATPLTFPAHDKDHAGDTSEGHGRGHGEQARKEAHQPRGAAPGLQPQAVQAFGSRKRSGEEERQIEAEEAMSRLARSSTTPTTHQFTELTAQTVLLGALPAQVCNGGDRQHVQFPTAATPAGANMRKMAGFTGQRAPKRGRMTRPTPSGGEDA
jgi:hypothetical protein